jgi:hypothetical protein
MKEFPCTTRPIHRQGAVEQRVRLEIFSESVEVDHPHKRQPGAPIWDLERDPTSGFPKSPESLSTDGFEKRQEPVDDDVSPGELAHTIGNRLRIPARKHITDATQATRKSVRAVVDKDADSI